MEAWSCLLSSALALTPSSFSCLLDKATNRLPDLATCDHYMSPPPCHSGDTHEHIKHTDSIPVSFLTHKIEVLWL